MGVGKVKAREGTGLQLTWEEAGLATKYGTDF